jgi:hypothetical protein
MTRSPRTEHPERLFGLALAAAQGRAPLDKDEAFRLASEAPLVRATLPFADTPETTGGPAQWRSAADLTGEDSADAGARRPSHAPGCMDTVQDPVLHTTPSLSDLRRARRSFMWRHHPDRLPAEEREGAHTLAASANRTFDEAVARIRKKPR